MSYIQDPNNPNKQVAAGTVYPSTAGIPAFANDTLAKVAKPAIGTMTFSIGTGKLWIYDGAGWKYTTLST